jgi:hypothetical protein
MKDRTDGVANGSWVVVDAIIYTTYVLEILRRTCGGNAPHG